ncbi:isopentenyl-diphosphate Delta-isomerase [Pseudochryseolinea flava]|uniref:Isopentenyl-diphosphate delta-isomerase n=1 Tax=Pseudochryseolinea flava TaxID=2059302 RepID=A0A364XW73_9BACT|nr:isopentenyl-diphosphate Delta-isomerase [Pseudochryseolinea flava]RAV98625.1 isopentenyl-diphosphate delta-isomerase [Pseudochryseolinea flava]
MEKVILVDEADNAIGTMEKMEAHRSGKLHRAFSILLFNDKGELLLQKRAKKKYHSGGLWTNTCCSHPLPDESMDDAARRKLNQEMGIDLQAKFAYKFIYTAKLDQGLTEHELDYVYFGQYNNVPNVNPDEVEDWKYINIGSLKDDIKRHPEQYTEWFKLIINHGEYQHYTL